MEGVEGGRWKVDLEAKMEGVKDTWSLTLKWMVLKVNMEAKNTEKL